MKAATGVFLSMLGMLLVYVSLGAAAQVSHLFMPANNMCCAFSCMLEYFLGTISTWCSQCTNCTHDRCLTHAGGTMLKASMLMKHTCLFVMTPELLAEHDSLLTLALPIPQRHWMHCQGKVLKLEHLSFGSICQSRMFHTSSDNVAV